jgi:hypothetical protein
MDSPRARLDADGSRVVLGTPPSAYTMTLLRAWMAAGKGHEAKYDARSAVVVPPGMRAAPQALPGEGDWGVRYAPGWAAVSETTVGRVVANGLLFSRSKELRAVSPYLNTPWDKKAISRMERDVADALLDGRISADDQIWFIDRIQWLGYAPTSFIAPSMTADTIRLPPRTAALKATILAGPRGDAVRSNDLKELAAVEKELLVSAEAEVGNSDPGMEIFRAGARGSFGNNYKNVAVMRGAIRQSDDPSIIHVSTASLSEGIPHAEMAQYADLMVQASYGRSMMTRDGGYIAKQLNAAFQGLQLDPDPLSDCRSTLLMRVTIDDPREYLYRFYRETGGGPLTQLMPAGAAALAGRTVDMRSPSYCGDELGICSRCAGTLYHRMGVVQIGLLASRIGTTLMNGALKAFHDTTLKMVRIDLSNYTKELPPPKATGESADVEDDAAMSSMDSS